MKMICVWICGAAAATVTQEYQLQQVADAEIFAYDWKTTRDLKHIALLMLEYQQLNPDFPPELEIVPQVALDARMHLDTAPDDNMYMVVDSGANLHYVSSEAFMTNIEPSISMVYGVNNI